MAGAIAPATVLRRYQDQPGAKAPGQRPPRPRRALRPRRVGRWPFVGPGPAGLQGTVAHGRGKRGSRFLVPPEQAKALPPRQWQGPSPLPPCYADIRTSWGPKAPGQRPPRPRRALRPRRVGRWPLCLPELPVYSGPFRSGGGNAGRVSRSRPEGRQYPHRFNGRGHCPCHSAAPGSGPAGGQSPRPAPAPPPAGASRPPGRALASVSPGTTGLQWTVPLGRGKRGSRFPFPPALTTAPSPLQWQGPSPLPQRCAGIRTGRGPKAPGQRPPRPRRALPARRVGRWPLLLPDLPVCRVPSRAGGGNAGRVSWSRPKGPSLSPDHEESPARQAVGLLFQHPVRRPEACGLLPVRPEAAPDCARPEYADGNAALPDCCRGRNSKLCGIPHRLRQG